MADRRSGYAKVFAVSIGAVAVAYASAFLPGGAPRWAAWLMAAGTGGSLASVMALGASRRGRLGPLGPVFLFVFVTLTGGFGAALLLEGRDAGGADLWLGLPPAAAVILYGVGTLPLVVVPLAYALTFERYTLDGEDWERIREVEVEPPTGPRSAAPERTT